MTGRTAAETRKLETIGELMRQNGLVYLFFLNLSLELMGITSCQAFVRALKPLLLSEGYSPETVDRFIAGTDKGMF